MQYGKFWKDPPYPTVNLASYFFLLFLVLFLLLLVLFCSPFFSSFTLFHFFFPLMWFSFEGLPIGYPGSAQAAMQAVLDGQDYKYS